MCHCSLTSLMVPSGPRKAWNKDSAIKLGGTTCSTLIIFLMRWALMLIFLTWDRGQIFSFFLNIFYSYFICLHILSWHHDLQTVRYKLDRFNERLLALYCILHWLIIVICMNGWTHAFTTVYLSSYINVNEMAVSLYQNNSDLLFISYSGVHGMDLVFGQWYAVFHT